MDEDASRMVTHLLKLIDYIFNHAEGCSVDEDLSLDHWKGEGVAMPTPPQTSPHSCGINVICNLHCLQYGVDCDYQNILPHIKKKAPSLMLLCLLRKKVIYEMRTEDFTKAKSRMKYLVRRDLNQKTKRISDAIQEPVDESVLLGFMMHVVISTHFVDEN